MDDVIAGLALNPEDIRIKASLLSRKGTIFSAGWGLQEQGEKYYTQTIELDPKQTLAHFNLGLLYKEQKKLVLAKKEFEEALKINPNHANAKIWKSRLKSTV